MIWGEITDFYMRDTILNQVKQTIQASRLKETEKNIPDKSPD